MVSKVVSGLSIAMGVIALLVLQTCSSGSGPRDQNWGSDVGRGYDAAPPPSTESQDASEDEAEDAATGSDMSTSTDATDDLNAADTTMGSGAGGASGGETMDGEAMTAQYTGGSRGSGGAAP